MSHVIGAVLALKDMFSNPSREAIRQVRTMAREFKQAGRDIQKAGQDITKVGQGLTKGITMPVIAMGTAAVMTAGSFDAGMSQVAATMGKTKADIVELRVLAKEMGKTTKFSAKEASEGINILAMSGVTATEDFKSLMPDVLDLASAGNLALESSSKYLTGSIKGFGDSMKNSQYYADLMAKGATLAKTNVDELGMALSDVSSNASAYGQTAESTTLALLRLADQGIVGTEASTMLSRTIADLYNPTDEAKEALDYLGVSAYDAQGNFRDINEVIQDLQESMKDLTPEQKTMISGAILTTNGLKGFNKICATSVEDLKKMKDGLADIDGSAAQQAATQLDNLPGRLTILKSSLEGIAITVGEKLMPKIEKAVGRIQDIVGGVADKIAGMSDEQFESMLKVVVAIASIGPGLMIFGKAVSIVGALVSAFGTVSGAIAGAGGVGAAITAFATGPVGIAIAAVAGLVAAGVLLYKNWDKVKAFGKSTWEYIKKIMAGVGLPVDNLKSKFLGLFSQVQPLITKFQDCWRALEPVIRPVAQFILNGFLAKVKVQFSALVGYVSAGINGVMDIASGAMKTLGGLLDFITGIFTGDTKKAFNGLKTFFEGWGETVVATFKLPVNAIIGGINGAISAINQLDITIPDFVPGIGGNSFNLELPQIPYLYKGTENWAGGPAYIHDRGAELVDLPSGSRVIPHDESLEKMRAMGYVQGQAGKAGSVSITVAKLADSIVVRSEADIDDIAEKLATKLQKTALNMGLA